MDRASGTEYTYPMRCTALENAEEVWWYALSKKPPFYGRLYQLIDSLICTQEAASLSLATPTKRKTRTNMSVFFCLRSGSTETDTDAIDKVAIAIPPRAFP